MADSRHADHKDSRAPVNQADERLATYLRGCYLLAMTRVQVYQLLQGCEDYHSRARLLFAGLVREKLDQSEAIRQTMRRLPATGDVDFLTPPYHLVRQFKQLLRRLQAGHLPLDRALFQGRQMERMCRTFYLLNAMTLTSRDLVLLFSRMAIMDKEHLNLLRGEALLNRMEVRIVAPVAAPGVLRLNLQRNR